MRRINIRVFAVPVGALFFAICILALVIFSPVALQRIARIHGINWKYLSNVGQTYGAVSAFLTAVALGGVVISLLYQARSVRIAQEQAARTFHYDLLKMEMGDPFYMNVMAAPWGLRANLTDYDSLRQYHFGHMWVSYWEGKYAS